MTQYKHIRGPSLLWAIVEVYSAIAEHITRILLVPGPPWWPRGEKLHDAAYSRPHFVPSYGMQMRACSSARTATPRWPSHSYQEPAASPWASIASPPNSPWLFTKTWYKEWGWYLYLARNLLSPSIYKLCILCSGGRTHAHGMAKFMFVAS
jgi:hypothetical protein